LQQNRDDHQQARKEQNKNPTGYEQETDKQVEPPPPSSSSVLFFPFLFLFFPFTFIA
jgi:hypothetical protein